MLVVTQMSAALALQADATSGWVGHATRPLASTIAHQRLPDNRHEFLFLCLCQDRFSDRLDLDTHRASSR